MISERVKTNLKQTFSRSLLPKLGLALLLLLVFMAVFAPVLATHDPTRTGYYDENGAQYPPLGTDYTADIVQDGERVGVTVESTGDHILGTNNVGQDVYSRFLYGARISLLVGLLGTGMAVLIGVPIGLGAGYYGGRVDDGLMRIADTMLAFPALVLALALLGVFGQSPIYVPDPIVRLGLASGMPDSIPIPGTVTVVVALVTWVWFARVARGEALSIRNEEYVKAAKSFGTSDRTILRQHVLPNSLTPIIVLATIQVAAVILLEASLAYLGFSGTTLSWGYEIERGQDILQSRPWVSVFPGVGIVLAVISVNLLGDWLRDALDPNIEGEGR
ncbi:ABC transporter permease [Haloterrigena alkaliphila]|uniref:ABC transporter permease n=1 Tax=Haloterrigena alkaliphila TaxID=2816475 RepID=A0A8A2VC98_9EURY|nr:ABC transporter permease [Haloterrigena alkaliphila]QSW99131.1 ABC transporter permease [Haloterrigena alkaliphila]